MAEANQDLQLTRGQVIPAAELRWTFGPSGGPGGQHANRANSRAELRFSVEGSTAFAPRERDRLVERLGSRMRDGVVTVIADDERSQWRNRQLARRRLKVLLDEALAPDPPPRRPTRPGRAARRRRMDDKRKRGETKRLRRRPEPD